MVVEVRQSDGDMRLLSASGERKGSLARQVLLLRREQRTKQIEARGLGKPMQNGRVRIVEK